MVSSIESRLWLAVHLLYSNASQAFDVYQAVILQSEHAVNNGDTLAVYNRLYQVYEKIPAIGSSFAFYEFEFEEIDQWKVIYKNSQKNQLIIFIGVLIFELKISDIATVVKLHPEKTQFLFQQIFKKLASTSQKLKLNEQLEFKKQNDNKISYLFTYENLVDYCLGQLNEEDNEKVKTGLKLYPMLQVAKEEYSRIISQIQNLKVQKERAVIAPDAKPNLKIVNNDVTSDRYLAKGLTKNQMRAIIGAGITIGLILLIQPFSYLKQQQSAKNTVILQEVNLPETPTPTPAVAEVTSPAPAPAAAAAPEPSPTPVPESTPAPAPVQAAAPAPKPAPVPVPAPVAVAATTADTKTANDTQKPTDTKTPAGLYEGGLYRGTLFVADLKETNQKIKTQLNSLGAAKAGEVELGWLKAADLAYYHYTLPEKNMAQAETYLKTMGRLQIKFEKHPRKVPVGSRRFIIEVKQN